MTDIHIGSRVQLKANRSGVYVHAPAGAVGEIRDKRQDEGFDLVYVRWDRRESNSEDDGWTFAEHFTVLEGPTETLPRFTKESEEESVEENDEYVDFLCQAMDVASDADAFFVLSVKETEDGMGYLPQCFAVSQSEIASILLEAQIVQLAADAHRHASMRAIHHAKGIEGDD